MFAWFDFMVRLLDVFSLRDVYPGTEPDTGGGMDPNGDRG